MSEVTIIQVSKDELNAIINQAIERAVMKVAENSGKECGLREAATILQCSERTVQRMEKLGAVPYRVNGRWLIADLLKHRQGKRQAI